MSRKAKMWVLTGAGACLGFALVLAGYSVTTWQYWAVIAGWLAVVWRWM